MVIQRTLQFGRYGIVQIFLVVLWIRFLASDILAVEIWTCRWNQWISHHL